MRVMRDAVSPSCQASAAAEGHLTCGRAPGPGSRRFRGVALTLDRDGLVLVWAASGQERA
jgi:hypothetical protein